MSDTRITYTFVAAGHGAVVSAFESVEKAAEKSAKATERAGVRRDRAARHVASSEGKAASAGASEVERAALREVRAVERAAQQQAKAREHALAHVARIRDRYFLDEQRQGEKAERATQRRYERSMAIAQRADEKIAASHRQRVAKIGERVSDIGAGALTLAGGFAAGLGLAGARDIMRLNSAATRLSIGARGAGEAGVDPAQLRREFEQVAVASPGVKAADVADATQGFVSKTGDLGAARQFAGTFATVASATGGDVQDIANAAADLFQKFDIKTIDDMRSALAALTFQGKSGAFELKDAASQFGKLSAAAQRFGLDKGARGVATLGGLTQIARSATGSPEQAATAVEAMFRQIVAKSGDLHKLGVDVFKDKGHTQTRDIRDVLVDSISKSGGNLVKLQDIFGEEGIRGISPLISAFNTAKNSAVGANGGAATEEEKTAAGVRALRAALESAIDAPGDWAEVVKDAAAAAKDPANQMTAAWEQFKTAIDPVVAEALPQFATAITTAATTIKKVLGAVLPGTAHDKTHTEQLTEAQGALAAFDKQNGDPSKLTGFLQTKRAWLAGTVDREKKAAEAEQTPEGQKIMAARAKREDERNSLKGRLAGSVDRFLGNNMENDESAMRAAEDRAMAAALAIRKLHGSAPGANGEPSGVAQNAGSQPTPGAGKAGASDATLTTGATADALKKLQDAATTTAAVLKDIKPPEHKGNAFVGG